MILFPNSDITIFNKYYNKDLERDCYKRTVIKDVDWQEKIESDLQDKGLKVETNVNIFLDKENYISPKKFRALDTKERDKYFTLDVGDYIVKGIVSQEINSFTELEKNFEDAVSILGVSKCSEHFEVMCK